MTPYELIEVFKDTQRIFRTTPALWERTQKSQRGSILYLEGYTAPIRRTGAARPIEVVETTTFQCARDLCGHYSKTAVLNFANPHEPGGGVLRGAMAQEECLCRCSDLYEVLAQPYFRRHYYSYHYSRCDELFSDRLIYSPGVTVIKSDDPVPRLLERPFSVDVITCAAPFLNNHVMKTNDELLEIYRSRIRNILEAAIAQEVDCLILGAFGCGAFGNDPGLMSRAFADLLIRERYSEAFRRVVFAIKRTGSYCPNIRAFRQAFEG